MRGRVSREAELLDHFGHLPRTAPRNEPMKNAAKEADRSATTRAADSSAPSPESPPAAEPAAAEWAKLDSLVPWVDNPRKNAKAVKPVCQSIKRFGWGRTLVAQLETRRIIIGHTARKAALELAKLWRSESPDKRKKWHAEAVRTATKGEVPVRFKAIPDDEAEKLARADNKLGELSEWDEDLIKEQVGGLTFGDAILEGWSGKDLAKFSSIDAEDDDGSSPGLDESYQVVVECADEASQMAIIEWCQDKGLKCRALI
jgi:hypothetical protein